MSYKRKLQTYFSNLSLIVEGLRKAGLEREDIDTVVMLRRKEAEFLRVHVRRYIPDFSLRSELLEFLSR